MVPAGQGCHRCGNFRQADAAEVVAHAVDPGQQHEVLLQQVDLRHGLAVVDHEQLVVLAVPEHVDRRRRGGRAVRHLHVGQVGEAEQQAVARRRLPRGHRGVGRRRRQRAIRRPAFQRQHEGPFQRHLRYRVEGIGAAGAGGRLRDQASGDAGVVARVLLARDVVVAHVVGQRDVVAGAVGDHQRAARGPPLHGAVELEDLRAGVRLQALLEDAVGGRAEDVGPHVEGEWRFHARHEVVFVLLRRAVRLGKAVVQPDAPRARAVGQQAVEDLAAVAGLVEALIEEIAQVAARLRLAVREHYVEVGAGIGRAVRAGRAGRRLHVVQRVGAPLRVLVGIAQEAVQVAHRGEADAHHHRVLGPVDEAVDRARVGGLGSTGRLRHRGRRGEVDADRAVGIADVIPGRHRHGGRQIVLLARAADPRLARREHHFRAVGERCRHVVQRDVGDVAGVVGNELVMDDAGDRRAILVPGDRKNGPEVIGDAGAGLLDVALPAAPHGRVAALQQRREGGRRWGPGHHVGAAADVAAEVQLAAAIDHVVHEDAACVRRRLRPQDDDVGRVGDVAVGPRRRQLQVDDAGIVRMVRIQLAVDDAGDHGVGARGTGRRCAAVGIYRGQDLELVDHARCGRCGRDGRVGRCIVISAAGGKREANRQRCNCFHEVSSDTVSIRCADGIRGPPKVSTHSAYR